MFRLEGVNRGGTRIGVEVPEALNLRPRQVHTRKFEILVTDDRSSLLPIGDAGVKTREPERVYFRYEAGRIEVFG
jgi:hypothetical protein